LVGRFVFFFPAEDGIRDDLVTGVQTCALPIFVGDSRQESFPDSLALNPGSPEVSTPGNREKTPAGCRPRAGWQRLLLHPVCASQIGRASCRERVCVSSGAQPVTEMAHGVERGS